MPEDAQNRKRVVVLGAGFTGIRLFAELSGQYDVSLTSRKGNPNGKGTPENCIYFDLAVRQSWQNVLDADFVVWTFPAATEFSGIADALALGEQLRLRKIPVAVLASTSCYMTQSPDQLVDETFPLDESQPRVCAEEELRKFGCLILALAGLYGTGRDPAGWLKRGLIKNAHSFINLIHVSDVVKIIRCWLEIPLSGIRLNVSDGRHRRWHELAEQLVNCGTLQKESTHFLSDVPTVQSKRVNNSVLVRQLYSGPFHAYPEDGL